MPSAFRVSSTESGRFVSFFVTKNRTYETETIAIHAGNFPDDTNRPAIQALTLATTFALARFGTLSILTGIKPPNRAALENVLALLEGGMEAAAFSSGNAARHARCSKPWNRAAT